jgi:hypothetical protein
MTKKLFVLFSIVMLTATTGNAESTNLLCFPAAGFTIAALDAPPGDSTQQALMMFLPVNDGFAANVNVQIQPYAGTMEEYVALTLDQFKSAGIKVLQQKKAAKSVVVFEYSGEMQGRELRWYARAEKSGGSVYLVTATATGLQWKKEAARLKSCVDSFRCGSGDSATLAPPHR